MRRIGLTGGIGAGKSAVTDWLRVRGYVVIDADEVAREAALPGAPALARVREAFGDGVFLADGALDRKALAALVFSDPEKLAALNEIFHADVYARMEEAFATAVGRHEHAPAPAPAPAFAYSDHPAAPCVFFSIPLLFETGAEERYDEVWLVTAPEDLRIARAAARDGCGSDEIRARIRNQLPEAEKRAKADVIIENGSSLEALHAQLEDILRHRGLTLDARA